MTPDERMAVGDLLNRVAKLERRGEICVGRWEDRPEALEARLEARLEAQIAKARTDLIRVAAAQFVGFVALVVFVVVSTAIQVLR